MMTSWRSRLLRLVGASLGAVLLAGAANVGTVGSGVVVGSGSPFRRTCAPYAVRGYLVEPTATTVGASSALVAAWQVDRALPGANGIVAATSSDGGRWTSRVVPGLARCEGGHPDAVSDPWLSAGPDGTVYLITDAVTAPSQTTIAVVRSLDQGRSWQRPVVLKGPEGEFSDKPTLTADPYRPATAFATWNDVGRGVMFSRTLDGGRSWSSPRVLTHSSLGAGADMFPEVAILPDGALTLVTTSYEGRGTGPASETLQHLAQTSTDLGASWSPQIPIDRLTSRVIRLLGKPFGAVRAAASNFSLTSGPQGVYLVSALVDSPSRSRLVMSHQDPDGTWTQPQTIATTNSLAVLPAIAAGADGKLAVTWDEITAVSRGGEALATINAAVGEDGSSWTTRRLGQPFLMPHIGPSELFIGDYQALTPAQNGFDAIDISTRGRRTLQTIVESFTFG